MSIDIPMLDNEYIYIKLILAWHKYTVLEPSLKTELHVVAKKKKNLLDCAGAYTYTLTPWIERIQWEILKGLPCANTLTETL